MEGAGLCSHTLNSFASFGIRFKICREKTLHCDKLSKIQLYRLERDFNSVVFSSLKKTKEKATLTLWPDDSDEWRSHRGRDPFEGLHNCIGFWRFEVAHEDRT